MLTLCNFLSWISGLGTTLINFITSFTHDPDWPFWNVLEHKNLFDASKALIPLFSFMGSNHARTELRQKRKNWTNEIQPIISHLCQPLVLWCRLFVQQSTKTVLTKTDAELRTYLFPFHSDTAERIWLFCHWPYFIHNSKLPIATALTARNQPSPVWISNRHYDKWAWSTSTYRYSGCSS